VNTLKSAALVIVLAGVLYGVYVTLHQPPAEPPPGISKEQVEKDTVPPEVDFGPGGTEKSISAVSSESGEDSPRKLNPKFPRDEKYSPSRAPGSASAPPETIAESLPPGPDAATALPEQPVGHETPLADGNPRAGEINLTAANFKRDWISATYLVDEGKFRDALATLTPYYRSPDLNPDQQAQLLEWLDALAAKVIYSNEHLLASPHVVTSDRERLVDVARKYGVSTQLLASINHDVVNNPNILVVTTRLKVVPGPFRAEVDLKSNEITIFLGNLYGGRFPFALGDEPPAPGEYQVRETKMEKTYQGERVIAAGDPSNPYGQWWIDLGNNASIHGSPARSQPGKVLGCISLSPQDAQDVAAILSVGSKVIVR
jgi:lipoprotein-anchoring transpeptidase ErfK/SrfK